MYYTMKKKIVISIITIILCFVAFVPSFVCAKEPDKDSNLNNIYISANGGFGDAKLQNKTGEILGLIQVIGYVTAVVMATVMGIKYILASPEGKADLKKTMLPFAIGCIILTAGTVLVSVVALFSHSTL